MHASRLSVLFAAVLVASAAAQTVLTVGPGGFPTISSALAVAQPGAIVEIAPGQYPAFSCNVGVTLRASNPGTVNIDLVTGGPHPSTGLSVQFAAPAGQTIHVVGLRFMLPAVGTQFSPQPELFVGSDAVFEDCTLYAVSPNGFANGSLRVGSAAVVHLQNVTSQGPLLLVEGRATASQCAFTGALSFTFAAATAVIYGTLHASNSVFVGGSSNYTGGREAVYVDATGQLFATDCTIQHGTILPVSACAVVNYGMARLVRVASNTPACLPAPAASGLGARRAGPVVRGGTFAVDYRTEPFVPLGVHLSHALASVPLPFTTQPWGAPLGGSFEVAFGLTNAGGQASFGFAIPNIPALAGLPVWLHGWSGWTFPLDVAPPVGGLVR
ncbi:MAG: hypothetical protein ACK595_20070 [Planctomycetota bacterium]|jgi:hypothetical protein